MSYIERNRERVTAPSFGTVEDFLVNRSRTLGTVLGKIDCALIYLDCGDPERAALRLREAMELAEIKP